MGLKTMSTIETSPTAPVAATSARSEHEFLKRLVVVLIGVPVVVGIVLAGGWLLGASLALLAAGGAREFYGLAAQRGTRPFSALGMVAAAGVVLIATMRPRLASAAPLLWLVSISLPLVLAAAVVWRRTPHEQPFAAIGTTVVGAMWTGGSLAFALFLRHVDRNGEAPVMPMTRAGLGAAVLLFPMVLTWVNDSCAYMIGRSWGRHKLRPQVSPKKTVEGALAGMIGAMLAGMLYALLILRGMYDLPFGVVSGGLAGLLIAIVGQIGDLAKSVLKREAGVKDAGRIFPGHGGIIDRFDSLFFALPVTYWYLTFFLPL